jgi:hypothetical protein
MYFLPYNFLFCCVKMLRTIFAIFATFCCFDKTQDGKTALKHAIDRGHMECVRLLYSELVKSIESKNIDRDAEVAELKDKNKELTAQVAHLQDELKVFL